MSHPFHCPRGHCWTYEEEATQNSRALFCPTCGLRLYPASEATALALPKLAAALLQPTPFYPSYPSASWSLNRRSGEFHLPAVQPADIEEIPGYELLGILGRGGMGIVYRARQLSLKRQVALKMILTGRHARPEDRARFQREAEAVARLHHPNIVQIYEVGEQNGLPYFSLEFVNAGSLAQFLNGDPQPPLASGRLVLLIAHAMHYAHKRGIVHRDLKPGNILLHLDESQIQRGGEGPDPAVFRALDSYVPKISDFGLALRTGGDEGPSRYHGFIGTPSYMAPEQAGGGGEVGPAADVYALGAVLYEMLTGRPPFKATSAEETALLVVSQKPVPPTVLQPKIPADLETICLACLHKDPNRRYASAEALAEDLRRFLANEPILARPVRLPDRVWKWGRRHPVPIGTWLVLATLASGLVVHNSHVTEQLRHDLAQSQEERATLEASLSQAVGTIDALLTPSPGLPLVEERRRHLEAARLFYTRLAAELSTHDPRQAALAYTRLADCCTRLGDPAAAEKARMAARQVVEAE